MERSDPLQTLRRKKFFFVIKFFDFLFYFFCLIESPGLPPTLKAPRLHKARTTTTKRKTIVWVDATFP